MPNSKFFIDCIRCNHRIDDFSVWFKYNQRCPECGSDRADVVYTQTGKALKRLLTHEDNALHGLWYYFDVLPVIDRANVISGGEGIVPIDRWMFLERYVEENRGIHCKVYAHRHDDNFATGTFKDLAASVVASVLNENDIKQYVVASTGNIGVAYSRYLSAAGISLYAFIPQNASKAQEAEIGCFGQKVFRVNGDYTRVKKLALAFAQMNRFLLAAGNYDPMRVESKKTMMFEWIRLMDEFPTVYIQGVSGGTGPLGIAKGIVELQRYGMNYTLPRFLLVQSNKCSPMADAWKNAKARGFPNGWEQEYPIYHNPETIIPTLATGYPKTYPVIGKLVRQSGGEIIDFNELELIDVARLVAFETSVRMGPAAAIAVGGFLKALKFGTIKDGDVVLINIGEGMRRSPEFMERLIYTTTDHVKSIRNCSLFDRQKVRQKLWKRISSI